MTTPVKRRIVILAEGKLDVFSAKTAAGVIRYRGDEVVGLLDRTHAGQPLEGFLGVGRGIPIVSELRELDAVKPDMLLIGIAPSGGQLPPSWRRLIVQAIERGMEIVSGLHAMLGDDPEFAELARKHGVRIWDVRRPPEDIPIGLGRARNMAARTVLTVGSDCNIGKKIGAIEMTEECRRRGRDAVFVPTGQTGVMITGRGLAIDRVISDFVAGAAESLVLAEQGHDWIFVEGQGGIFHPSFSGVTLALMHGSCPKAMVLCHQPTRRFLRHTQIPIPPLREIVAIHEALMRPIQVSRVVGVALNCCDLTDEQAGAEVKRVEQGLQLPVTDVIRFGAAPLVDALERYFETPSDPASGFAPSLSLRGPERPP
ncbi:MAG: DUF1611 domain-containing protein [Planctomycetes bacterium]|nr:DUF1611 domain-containing protein [Planctomycetota bacterium]